MKTKITEQLKTNNSGFHLWVTHDTILATFASRVLHQPLTSNSWPDFLDYLDIYLDDENNLKYNYFHHSYMKTV